MSVYACCIVCVLRSKYTLTRVPFSDALICLCFGKQLKLLSPALRMTRQSNNKSIFNALFRVVELTDFCVESRHFETASVHLHHAFATRHNKHANSGQVWFHSCILYCNQKYSYDCQLPDILPIRLIFKVVDHVKSAQDSLDPYILY